MSIEDGFSADDNVDAVSKATISSVAMTKAVQKAAVIAGRDYYGVEVVKPALGFRLKMVDLSILLILVLTIVASLTKNKKLRLITLIYSVKITVI